MANRVPTGTPAVELKSLSKKSPFDRAVLKQSARPSRRAASSMASLEQSVFQQINQYRQQRGLSALKLDSTIIQQARQHSQDMAKSRVLSHDGFDTRVKALSKAFALRAAGENVAFNAGFRNPVAQAVNGWLNSPGHLQNIVGNYNWTGVGVAKNSQGEYYFTQIFVRT